MQNLKTVAVFQSWENGGLQISSLCIGAEAEKMEENHYMSGTFACLHSFTSEEEGRIAYEIAWDRSQEERDNYKGMRK